MLSVTTLVTHDLIPCKILLTLTQRKCILGSERCYAMIRRKEHLLNVKRMVKCDDPLQIPGLFERKEGIDLGNQRTALVK